MLAGERPKSTNSGLLMRTELLAKFILSHALTSATSMETASKPITPLKWDVEWPFMAKDTSMGASNGSELLVSWTDNLLIPEARWGDGVRVGYWAWGTQPGVLIGAGVPWHGVIPAPPAYLPRSPLENLRTISVTIAFGRTVWRRLKISCTPITSAVTSGLIDPMMPVMIFVTNRLINNFCVNFPLVV